MRRLAATIPIVLAMLLLAACGDEAGEGRQPAGDVAGTAAAEETSVSEPSPSPAINASTDRDPREVLVELFQDPKDPNTELIYQHLSERFRVLEYGETWVQHLIPIIPTDFDPAPEDLEVEEYDGYSVLRQREFWPAKSVFVIEDGEWRLDPGNRNLLMAAQIHAGAEGGRLMGSPDDYQMQSTNDSEDGPQMPLAVGRLEAVGVHDDAVDVAVRWEVRTGHPVMSGDPFDSHLMQDTIIPLDSVTWHAGGQSGGVEVRWTDAALAREDLVLRGWPDEDSAEEAAGENGNLFPLRYEVTLRLLGVPDDAEEIVLQFDEIRVGPIGDDYPDLAGEVINYAYEFTFPAETTDSILVGEAPEPREGDDAEVRMEPPTDQELPPAPGPVEALKVADIDYEFSNDSVEALASLGGGETRFEFPGPARVIWDDGVVTEAETMFAGQSIEITAERSEPPLDAEVAEIEFERLVYSLGTDENATFHEDRIETEWGDFSVIDIRDDERIEYQPAGNRWLRSMVIDHEGNEIGLSNAGARFDEDFKPSDTHFEFGADLGAAIGDLPLSVHVEVWAAEKDVTFEIE